MQYQRFDPTSCKFPQPKVAVLPALQRHSLGKLRASTFKPLGTDGNVSFFTRGRYAITEAFRLSGLNEETTLLAPAYHCRTMLDPAIRLGAAMTLYPLNDDLSPNLSALAACLSESQKPVRVMLLTHYFGFAQNLRPIVDFCAQHDITLLEDCSHALFIHADSGASTEPRAPIMGKAGRYGVASPYKFFSSEDGGLLWANVRDEPPLPQQKPQPFVRELKAIVHALQHARAAATQASAMKHAMSSERVGCQVAPPPEESTYSIGADTLEQTPLTSTYYQPEQEHLQGLASSRWVMRHTDVQRLADRRRQHYQQWVTAVAGLPHCRTLFPDLPDDCVPYMFPLYIDHPDPDFFALKQLGMPIWRWDDMAMSDCPVASDFRLHLLHLPCHQELSATQMSWMSTTLQKVMQREAGGHRT
jgi:perosamine synthetase